MKKEELKEAHQYISLEEAFNRKGADIAYTINELCDITGRTKGSLGHVLADSAKDGTLCRQQIKFNGAPQPTYIYYLPENQGKIEELLRGE